MRILKPATIYFLLVFGTGFVLGVVRTLWLVPKVGTRVAELAEMPLMLVAIVLAAWWTNRHGAGEFGPKGRLGIGAIALAMLLTAEVSLAVILRGVSVVEALMNRDPVVGAIYFAILAVFATLPWLLGTCTDSSVIHRKFGGS